MAIQITFEDILSEVSAYLHQDDSIELLTHAYNYAAEKHKHQYRKSGEPYIIHLLQVGHILAQLKMSPTTIAAGLLHDVIEDCGISKEELAQEFNEEIATLVESVTKIGNIEFKDEKEYQAANHRKIFIAMAKDIRVIFIKLVDRLHNMRTLQFQSPEKQKRIAQETLDVYAPIAHRLGFGEIKNELEDISFSYLHKDNYYEIARLVTLRKAQRDAQVTKMIEEIAQMLLENNIKFNIFGRSKHLYSIYKKMNQKHKRFDEILDLLAIRIITETELNCYEILGYIHAKYKPIPGRLKDYIAIPKVNMYQSLHTTVVGDDGFIFEIQIRTKQMDEVAEKGVAAHWRYKEGAANNIETSQKEIEDRLSWFRDFDMLTQDLNENNPSDYMSVLQKDIFEANVYAMTPNGRVIDLPNGATPIDFAYRVHTEVGHQTIGAIVNGVLVPLNTELKTGDIVKLKTSKQSSPSEDWLKIVKTANARNKIRNYLTKQQAEEKSVLVSKGEVIFRDECRRRNIDEKELKNSKRFEQIYSHFSVNSYDDLMAALASKALNSQAIFERLDLNKDNKSDEMLRVEQAIRKQSGVSSKTGVKVSGIDSLLINLSKCCNPVYGDEIVGYITKGQGVKVHRKDCPNIAGTTERLIDVYWDDEFSEGNYEVVLDVLSIDRNFLLTDIVTVCSQLKVKLNGVNSEIEPDKIHALTRLKAIVKDNKQLQMLIANIRKVDSVIRVDRKTL